MKIKKTATAKHEQTLSPYLRDFITTAQSVPLPELCSHLSTFPAEWPFLRGDLYHWISLLNRFDAILEENVGKYKLKDGPQTIPWEESDKHLVSGVLRFSKLLVENCGNRSLYASSGHINDLLNTTDLDILFESLSLGTRLAQRYYTSRTRGSTSTNATLLASHYNIVLERVVKIASPFVKGIATATTPAGKNVTARAVLPVYATDLGRLARDEKPVTEVTGKGKGKGSESKEGSWEEWGGAWISYYVNPATQKATAAPVAPASVVPTTPTPVRRTSLHHSHSASHSAQQTPGSATRGRRPSNDGITEAVDSSDGGGLHTLEVPYSRIKATSNIEEIIKTTLPELPSDTHYDFLQRVRVAWALAGDLETRRKILAIRILALTNLAYVYSEVNFSTKILALDQDEPRRLQLVYQMAELVQSNDGKKDGEVPRWLQTLALGGLEALARHKSRSPDVLNALSVNVNHGVLLYLMRRAVAEMAVEDKPGDLNHEDEEWRQALFSLVGFLPTTNHAGSLLVSAGLIPILIELVQLRTMKALRHIPRALTFLDTLIYSVATAFQTFAGAKGLDAVVDLVSDQVNASLQDIEQHRGMPKEHRSPQTDYEIAYYRQQALRMVFKFMQHMMGQSGGGADRLLRNLIDNAQLLDSLKIIIANGRVWGSNVWSTVLGMVSAFIHNEPTSYAAIHEARVTHTFLEAITGKIGLAEEEARRKKEEEDAANREATAAEPSKSGGDEDQPMEGTSAADEVKASGESPKEKEVRQFLAPAAGILPSPDVIGCIPTAFGAICLNASGLALFQSSGALETFFEIFESPDHVKQLTDGELGNLLGSQFDELVRHHPVLRDSVMKASIGMLDRVSALGKNFAIKGMGAKVWLDDGAGGLIVAGGRRALLGDLAIHNQPKSIQPFTGVGESSKSKVAVGETQPDGSPVGEVVTLADIYDEESEVTDNSSPLIADYIDVAARYFEGFLANSNAIRKCVEGGGLDRLLEFYQLPSLPHDFATSQANQMLCRVVHLCCENGQPDSLKAVFACARKAVDQLDPLLNYRKKDAFFAPLTNPSGIIPPPRLQAGIPASDGNTVMKEGGVSVADDDAEVEKQAIENVKLNGTKLVKNLVTVHSICFLLQDLYGQPMFNVRSSLAVFMQVTNEADQDNVLISKLGALQRMCVWEEILMQNGLPQTWNEATRVKDSPTVTAAVVEEEAVPSVAAGASHVEVPKTAEERKEAEKAVVEKEGKTARFRNVKTVRFLISQFPTTVTPFLQGLAKAAITRRTNDPSQKYQALKLVDSIADTMHQHLVWERLATSDSVNDKYSYWIVMLSAVMSLLLEGMAPDFFATPKNTPADRQPSAITTFLVTFKQRDGLEVIKDILGAFWDELKDMPTMVDSVQLSPEHQARIAHAFGGIKIILSLFAYLVSHKAVVESNQSAQLSNRSNTDYERSDYFNANQLLVELRFAILPMARKMWQEASIERASCSIVKSVIEILAVTLKADAEQSAFTRKLVEKIPSLKNTLSWKSMVPHKEQIKQLTEMGFPEQAAAEALMRSGGGVEEATHWLASHGDGLDPGFPLGTPRRRRFNPAAEDDDSGDDDDEEEEDITDIDVDVTRNDPSAETRPAVTAPQTEIRAEPEPASVPPPAPEMDVSEPSTAQVPHVEEGATAAQDVAQDAPMSMSIDELVVAGPEPSGASASEKGKEKQKEDEEEEPRVAVVTVEDLNELRAELRDSLINRSLDVLQVHPDTTFDLADLIKCAFSKSSVDVRKDVASTIVQSLLSLQMDDDLRPKAKTIASTAHLLGLILQSQDFYESCMEDLNEQLPILVGFIKVYPNEPAPWVANILLVVEKLLSEHSQPEKVKFVAPGQPEPETIVENTGVRIPDEVQDSLMDAILSILPNIGKEDLLPLSVTRILVLLTRRRELATRLMEKSNLQKVFHMLRRQAGTNKERVQSSIMLILRHIIEDEETIKNFMKSEIRAQLLNRNRQLDTSAFIKTSANLVLRNPEIFVDVVNSMCKLTRYEPNLRNQHLVLKEAEQPRPVPTEPSQSEEEKAEKADKGEDATQKEIPKEDEKEPADKPKPAMEIKPPGVEKPDGVVHFLLSELFAIKDVQDIITPPEPLKEESKQAEGVGAEEKPDVPMTVENNTTSGADNSGTVAPKQDKPEFKAEQHPTFLYRCFILQALTELLSCYNRCKIEFINFSRKANPRDPITPSKPRSAILSYLLNDLIPLESLSQPEDITYKKKSTTSQWAILTLVSLCTHTGEVPMTDDDPTLLFVRKFVLEVSLKAFKDTSASTEPLDSKYAKMLSLTDFFYRALSSRPSSSGPAHTHSPGEKPQLQISRIMLEKNFISALTTALADVDINFPSSRRVIKYMLKPLKLLSKTAVDLGEDSNLSAPGSADEDEISTASSVTDLDDLREETPDLYRNSTLGMFEGGEMGDDDASSFDEDEDDDDMYDEELEFDETMEDDNGSDISDEDEDEGDDMDVEIVVEGAHDHDHDDDSDEDDDDDLSDDMDEDGDVEVIEELVEGPHEHEPYGSGGEDDWHSEGSEDDDDPDQADDDGVADNPLETIARALGMPDDAAEIDLDDEDREDGFIDDGDDDEDLEGDDDDDDMEDDDGMPEDYDDDEGGSSAVPWGWANDGDAPVMTRAQPRGAGGWFTLTGTPREPPVFMSRAARPRHAVGAGDHSRNNQELNPLLQQTDNEPATHRHAPHRHEVMTDWVQAMDTGHGGGSAAGTMNAIHNLINLMHRGGPGAPIPNGTIQFHATFPQHHRHLHHGGLPREFQSMIGATYGRPVAEVTRHHREDPSHVVNMFAPTLTSGRWAEEARLVFGGSHVEVAQKVVNAILVHLVPPAVEEERIRKEKEEELRKETLRLEEERKKKEEEEKAAREKAEAEEKVRKEAEEKEAAERAAAEAAALEETRAAQAVETDTPAPEDEQIETPAVGEAMEGVETGPSGDVQAGPSESEAPRATVMIRGSEVDITGLGIDASFLEAIPDDLREEVLTNHVRERRAEAATNNQPSEISREFLDALPEEIREELVAQEAADRRRREAETARAAHGGAAEINLQDFLATLDPSLRQTVLLEQDQESLAQFPQAIIEEAAALRGDRRFHQFGENPRVARAAGLRPEEPKPLKKPVRKGTVQLLDKAGVATLLRLMFIPQVGSTRTTLHEILLNICENRQNRAEVVNLLLSILQDGSADMVSVERSFAQLSVRAKQPGPSKTPVQPGIKRTNTGSSLLAQTSGEISPLMVAQQCLNALLYLVNYNEHIPPYFLNEHDISTGLKRSVSRKGKGKIPVEAKANKYALNTLLSLLDRQLVTESSSVMDQLSVLLSEITRPLTILLKKDKKKPEDDKSSEEVATAQGEPPVNTDQPSTSEPGASATETAQPEVSSSDRPAGEEEPKEATKEEGKEDDKPKKPRNLVPPVVPEHNLRLVVNILTARECSSKTFRETLATMQNLSGIPGAKDVFGAELIRQAQGLGAIILGHLDELMQQIKSADNGTEVQGMALSNFSPASSEQAKLLRVLTALDYLFDPKRSGKDKPEDQKDQSASDAELKTERDVLARLYETLTFQPLWDKLSACLTAIHERSDMLHVATILLPLIESLMVVCKNSGLKEAPIQRRESKTAPISPEVSVPMRDLFFTFTEEHRKILNQMVRNNPKLMSGSFSLLVNNPKVLDFDNKRNYFNRRLHTRSGRESHPTLQLNVRRDQVFLDSYKSMYYKNGDEIKYAKLSIRFHGEEGVDAGGVTREWFQVMARQMFNPDYALFIPVASDRTTFHPNRMSDVNPEHLSFFKFIGRIIGKALYEGRVLDCHFSRAVYKRILGKSVSLKDMETLDLDFYKSLVWMLENDITDIITETFSVETDDFGVKKIIDLVPDGRNVPVTDENKHDYVRLLVEYRMLNSVTEQMEHFLIGFHDIVPAELVSIFNEQELELLISGMPEIDVDDWRNNTEYHNYSASSPQIQWFWRAIRSFDKEERAKLLQFVTGTSKVPLNGFKELEGMNGWSKFNIHRDYGNKDRLPSSHTCFNQIDLPEYESYENLRQNLLTAITQGAEYFGFA